MTCASSQRKDNNEGWKIWMFTLKSLNNVGGGRPSTPTRNRYQKLNLWVRNIKRLLLIFRVHIDALLVKLIHKVYTNLLFHHHLILSVWCFSMCLSSSSLVVVAQWHCLHLTTCIINLKSEVNIFPNKPTSPTCPAASLLSSRIAWYLQQIQTT